MKVWTWENQLLRSAENVRTDFSVARWRMCSASNAVDLFCCLSSS